MSSFVCQAFSSPSETLCSAVTTATKSSDPDCGIIPKQYIHFNSVKRLQIVYERQKVMFKVRNKLLLPLMSVRIRETKYIVLLYISLHVYGKLVNFILLALQIWKI